MESVKRMDGAKCIENRLDRLAESHILSREEFCFLLDNIEPEQDGYLYGKARKQALASYGNRIFVRGLIEFTNYCKNDCYYCGIRRSNHKASRYRLTPEQVMDCCHTGYGLGVRTFVLQGGEDPWFSDQKIAYLVECIRSTYPDCAITLSVGEKEYDTYKMWFDAGADRYLLRHETANPCHYASLHPPQMSSGHRKECLENLKAAASWLARLTRQRDTLQRTWNICMGFSPRWWGSARSSRTMTRPLGTVRQARCARRSCFWPLCG